MAQFGTKRFYFTACGFKAAESRASSFFRVLSDELEFTWLGVVNVPAEPRVTLAALYMRTMPC